MTLESNMAFLNMVLHNFTRRHGSKLAITFADGVSEPLTAMRTVCIKKTDKLRLEPIASLVVSAPYDEVYDDANAYEYARWEVTTLAGEFGTVVEKYGNYAGIQVTILNYGG